MDIEVISHEIATIMKWPYDDVLAQVADELEHPGLSVRRAWARSAPSTPQEIERFYQTTDAYIYDLMVEGYRPERLQWRQSISSVIRRYMLGDQPISMLDYGGGVGTDAMFWARRGFGVDYYDLPGITSAFAAARFKAHRLPINCVDTPVGPYDVAVSLEVLEHLIDPIEHVKRITSALRPGGLFLFSEAFGLTGEDYPSHLIRPGDAAREVHEYLSSRGLVSRELLHGRVHVYEYLPPLTVVVPVYNAYEHLAALLQSITKTPHPRSVEWLLIDDGSTDERIMPALNQFAAVNPRTWVVHRDQNLGFIATCNEGIRLAGDRDIILLNSDTITYANWTDALVRSVYSSPDIGSATPLSNNASIYSIFASILPSTSLSEYLDEIPGAPVDIPTGVGFCLYLKRAVLDAVGLLDPVFGVGYGEETDLCLRIAGAGYRNVLATNVFIYHAGGASMVAAGIIQAGESTKAENELIILKRYPHFKNLVESFYASGTMPRLRRSLEVHYMEWLSRRRKAVAYLLHHALADQTIGGTEFHVRDLISHLDGTYLIYVVAPREKGYSVEVCFEGYIMYRTIDDDLRSVIDSLQPSIVHIHHLLGYPAAQLEALLETDVPYLITVHDFYSLCPQYSLLSYRGEYCGVPEESTCNACAVKLFGKGFSYIARHRGSYQPIVDGAQVIIAPSHAAFEVLQLAFDVREDAMRVIPHPYHQPSPNKKSARRPQESLTIESGRIQVGFVGYRDKHKGAALQDALVEQLAMEPFDFVFVGGEGADKDNRRYTGLYSREHIGDILREQKVQVAVFTHNWPETFGYTLSEAWAAEIPVIVPPFGGPAERVRANGGGWVLPDYTLRAYVDILRQIAKDPSRLAAVREAIRRDSWDFSWQDYDELYATYASGMSAPVSLRNWVDIGDRGAQAPMVQVSPLLRRAWLLRARLFPVGTARERWYFFLRRRTLGY